MEFYTEAKRKAHFYVHRIPYNFVKAIDFIPYFYNEIDGEKKSEDYKPYCLHNEKASRLALSAINSNLFFWYWYLLFEGYHCGRHEIESFPLSTKEISDNLSNSLIDLSEQAMSNLIKTKSRKECTYKSTGTVIYEELYPRLSKPIIDQIDCHLAQHYGFTQEELDFIINYDIKYRMGRELDTAQEEE